MWRDKESERDNGHIMEVESMNELLSFLKDLGVLGGIAFLIKTVVDFFSKKRLEKFKILYAERAKVIAELYKFLSQMERAHNNCSGVISAKSNDEAQKTNNDLKAAAYESYKIFLGFANDNMIWFAKDTEEKISELLVVMNKIWADIEFLKSVHHIPDNDQTKTQTRNDIGNNLKKMRMLKEELATEFRKIIGI